MRLLDLFCGAGGAAEGYRRAGFDDIVGVDIDGRDFPFVLWQANAMQVLTDPWIRGNFDAIHASPPCQRYSDLAHRNGNGTDWPDYIPELRRLLIATGLPYVIENVEGSPLVGIRLCGASFPGLAVLRHRIFESNVPLTAPTHRQHPLVYTRDKRKAHYGRLDEATSFVSVNGGGNCSVARAREAMGIDWMTKAELNEAIPPVYTEYVGRQILEAL